jgi:hypothetical protein
VGPGPLEAVALRNIYLYQLMTTDFTRITWKISHLITTRESILHLLYDVLWSESRLTGWNYVLQKKHLIRIINKKKKFTYRYIDISISSPQFCHTQLSHLVFTAGHIMNKLQCSHDQYPFNFSVNFGRLFPQSPFSSNYFPRRCTVLRNQTFSFLDLILSSPKYRGRRNKFSVGKHTEDQRLITVSRVDCVCVFVCVCVCRVTIRQSWTLNHSFSCNRIPFSTATWKFWSATLCWS